MNSDLADGAPGIDSADNTDLMRQLDRLREAWLARVTGGLSPESLGLAFADWLSHLAVAPGKRLELAQAAWQMAMQSWASAFNAVPMAPARAADSRFAAAGWQQAPFAAWGDAFLRTQSWWQQATRAVPGVERHHEDIVAFTARQWLDALSPSNLPWLNPEVLQRTLATGGANLWLGAQHWLEDASRQASHQGPAGSEAFVVGRDLAATPGRVVMRNRLAELIQYTPATPDVHAEPVLLVPAWIMKYYILDLSQHNSLVRWLVAQGHTVFCLSWKNITAEDSGLALDDYRLLGPMAALDTIGAILPGRRVHAAGYCLGGTLLAIAAAAMARDGDERLATVSLLAAQTDFTEPGELQLFIDPSQVHMLDSMMWQRGYLTAEQMSGAFLMLQSKDLLWSRAVHQYLMGERPPLNDLMAWNADGTRMPYRMHSEYLHRLFLHNDLATGRIQVDGRCVSLRDIRLPLFAVGTETDHVAPWRSVYKIHDLVAGDVSFALTNGGHNAGIVSEPGHAHRHFGLMTKAATAPALPPQEWQAAAPRHEGSWWTAWQRWLAGHSASGRTASPPLGLPGQQALGDAPGSYVLQH